jgi:hypothetical protein
MTGWWLGNSREDWAWRCKLGVTLQRTHVTPGTGQEPLELCSQEHQDTCDNILDFTMIGECSCNLVGRGQECQCPAINKAYSEKNYFTQNANSTSWKTLIQGAKVGRLPSAVTEDAVGRWETLRRGHWIRVNKSIGPKVKYIKYSKEGKSKHEWGQVPGRLPPLDLARHTLTVSLCISSQKWVGRSNTETNLSCFTNPIISNLVQLLQVKLITQF